MHLDLIKSTQIATLVFVFPKGQGCFRVIFQDIITLVKLVEHQR